MAAISSERRKLLALLLQEKGLASSARQVAPRPPLAGPRRLSFAQQRMWVLDQLEGGGATYSVPVAVRLHGELNVTALTAALTEVVRRHEVLRTTFRVIDEEPVQITGPTPSRILPIVSLYSLAEASRDQEAHRLSNAEASRPFDLAHGPVLRATLLILNEQEHIALLNMHHIVSDAWSRGVLVNELAQLYEHYASGKALTLPELPWQYADYAEWQRGWLQGEVLDQQLSYWKEQLMEVPAVIDLPFDRMRPAVQTSNGANYVFEISSQLCAELKTLSRSENASLFMVLLAAFQVLLYRYTKQDHLAIGTPIAGRHRVETEGLIGLFVNTLVMKSELRDDERFVDFLRRVKETCLGAYAHQDVPFEKLVDELRVERSLSYSPLFQVMFMVQNTPRAEMQLSGVTLSPFEFERASAKFDLSLTMEERGERLLAAFEYNTDLFERRTIERMARHFDRLLAGIVANADVRVWELPLLSDEEQCWLRSVGKGEVRLYESSQLVHELFEEQAARRPNASALVDRERELSYGELNRRANQLAHYLRREGVGIESRVGVLLERKAELVVALLAVLKTGAAYVPLDPGYPAERLRFMVEDAGAEVLLSENDFELTSAVKQIRFAEEQWAAESETDLGVTLERGNLSHVIYTSGTTGRPKGVMITHGATRELVHWAREAYSAEELVGMLFSTSVCFDLSVFEMFAPLAWGGRVILAANALELGEVAGVRVVNTVPTTMKELLRMKVDVTGLTINLAGEALPDELVEQLYERGARRVINLYGPTEDTTYSTGVEVKAGERVTLGRALPNGRTYVLDEWLQEVPQGVVGELYLGGAGLARGYLGRSELTAERFVPDPYSEVAGERMYRTGDLVKYNGEEKLEYLGRSDQQVKLRGYRIELGEVETVLKGHAEVRDAVAVVREGTDGGAARLIAYVVAEGETEVNGVELGNYLRERLPEYMAPLQYVLLKELPQTANGKIDRKRLPEPEREERPRESVTGPRSWAEQVLCEIWAEVLRLEQVGVDENFFQLGGDSILSIQVASRASARGLRFTTRQIFQHQTVAALAAVAVSIGPAPNQFVKVDVNEPAPLTPIQHWFFEQVREHREHWNQAMLLKIRGPQVNSAALRTALELVQRQHPALNMCFEEKDGLWQQRLNPSSTKGLLVVELTQVSSNELKQTIEYACGEAQASLDLNNGRLLRAVLFRCGVEEPRLLIVIHHLVVDGVSWRVLLEDLQAAYELLQNGTAVEDVKLPDEVTSYTEWARYLNDYGRHKADSVYWLNEPGNFKLPLDHTDGENPERDAAYISESLTEEETEALLREVPGRYHTEINDALLTALGRSLWRWTGQQPVEIELEGHGREELTETQNLTRTVGWFTTIYPVSLMIGEEIDTDLKAVKERLRAVPKRGLDYGLLRYLTPNNDALRNRNNGQLVFNYLGQLDSAANQASLFRLASESSEPARWDGSQRTHVLQVNAHVAADRLTVVWGYSRQLHLRETIARVAVSMMSELRSLIAHCREDNAGGFTPSDFPAAQLSQAELDDFIASIT
ncbi:MAG TPA: amino acid adenylation domain-containing protein [Pyrinomonadaceae bacterium]